MNNNLFFCSGKTADAVIVSPDIYLESKNFFDENNIDIIYSFENKSADERLAYHADMQITRVGYNDYVCIPEAYDYYHEKLSKYGANIIKGDTYLTSNYPNDIAYNIIVTESYAVHNFKFTDTAVKQFIASKKQINVSQGYSSCSCCAIKDGVFITSDTGICNSLISNGLSVLKINCGDIKLPGYDYGFFGGSCGKISDDILVVNGNLSNHPDYNEIISFCKYYNVNTVSLSDNPIFDIGSLIPVFM